MTERENRSDKMAGFLYEALVMGYGYNQAWQLFLESPQGKGILSNDYLYCVHFEGRASARKADAELGKDYDKSFTEKETYRKLVDLCDLINAAYYDMNIEYKDMFTKTSLSDFMKICRSAIGDYNYKLIKAYLV